MATSRLRMRRNGFTLITVLWTMVVAVIITLAAALRGRATVNAARNRIQSERAYWVALGCARVMQATIDSALSADEDLQVGAATWRTLDRQTEQVRERLAPACDLELEAAGTRLDINSASSEMLVSLFEATGTDVTDAGDLATAVIDRRSTKPFDDIRELGDTAGVKQLATYEWVLSAEPGRVSLATAPVNVLRSVPGFTEETASVIAQMHDAGNPVRSLADLADRLPSESRDTLMARFSEIARITTIDPDAWILTTKVSSGFPASRVTLAWRVVRVGHSCAVVRTKTTL